MSAWVRRFASLVPARGQVLDVAAGSGRHTRFFLGCGHRVTAVDRDVTRLADIRDRPDLTILAADLEAGEAWPLDDRGFAGV
ncbi:MAG: SAM-dependent methyltransferase, partial [Geminicoccales bacterium]